MSSQENLSGGWNAFSSKIDAQAQQAFDEGFKGFVGMKYTAVAVSHQVVAGMNYRFFCNTTLVSPAGINGAAIVSIYKPLNGPAHITGIKQVD